MEKKTETRMNLQKLSYKAEKSKAANNRCDHGDEAICENRGTLISSETSKKEISKMEIKQVRSSGPNIESITYITPFYLIFNSEVDVIDDGE
jgi:hypothetical protein